jgi:hypothetical protein
MNAQIWYSQYGLVATSPYWLYQPDHAAKLELQHQRPADPADRRLGVDVLAQGLSGVVVGLQHQLEDLVEEEQRDDHAEQEDHRTLEQAGAELTEVVGQRHPAVRADGVVGPPREELEDSGD